MMPTQAALDARLDALLVQVQQLADRDVSVQDLQAVMLAYQQALAHLDAAWLSGGNTLDQLLHARSAALFSRMWLHLGTALLLLVSILSLVVVVARLISPTSSATLARSLTSCSSCLSSASICTRKAARASD